MLIQGIEFEKSNSPARSPKRMLSVREETDTILHTTKTIVSINYSSLEIIQTCKRKALYALEKELRSNEEGQATLFGSAIHKGLEIWYSQPKANRRVEPAIQGFMDTCGALRVLDISDKRHPYNGEKILNTYFTKYADDPFEVYVDDKGPVVERSFEFTLVDEPKLKIIYFGTIDAILRNVETNTILVCDHKTTSSLGSEFYNRLKPNAQYTGYLLGAKRALNIETDLFLINGLQVAKTKVDLARQITSRNDDDYLEFTEQVVCTVKDYLRAKEEDTWPLGSVNMCAMYGGCQYRVICETQKALRPQIIKNLFQDRN